MNNNTNVVYPNIIRNEQIKPYKKDFDYSYTLGSYPTIEMIKANADIVKIVYIHTDYSDNYMIESLCNEKHISVKYDNKIISKISDKENCYVVGIFNKFSCVLNADKPHIVLVNPSDMGNLGTIMRTIVGFGIHDIAIIRPCADIFHPKTIRSSMGAFFKLCYQYFDSFEEYINLYNKHDIFTFMLNGQETLTINDCPKTRVYSLVFGNEASGLDDYFCNIGTSILIPQSSEVDSLNLAIAVGIGAFIFTSCNII
jgi:TrmH family RNA methyltransferase